MNKYISIDIEADGPAPGLYSMISLSAVLIDKSLSYTFYSEMRPISEIYLPEALKVTGFSRAQTLLFPNPTQVMLDFNHWLMALNADRLMFVSDNAGFDWQFVNYYFHNVLGQNPFGYSPMSLTWFYKGLVKNPRGSFKKLRTTKHSHNALDDAMGNAEAFLKIQEEFRLNIMEE